MFFRIKEQKLIIKDLKSKNWRQKGKKDKLFSISFIKKHFMEINEKIGSWIISADKFQEIPLNYRKIQHKDLWISASKQPSELGFRWLAKEALNAGKTLYIIDLRQESHFFIQGEAITSYIGLHNNGNINLSLEEIKEKERLLKQSLLAKKTMTVYKRYIKEQNSITFEEPKEVVVDTVQTEEELLQKIDTVKYTRIPFTDHAIHQMSLQANTLFDLIENAKQSKNIWIHFHCHGGKARSATALLTTHLFLQGKKEKSIDEVLQPLFENPMFKQEAKKYRKISPYLEEIYAKSWLFKKIER